MNTNIIERISTPGSPLTVTDMTADEKKRLYTLMEQYGATQGFCWNRFFRDGFAQWELTGIDTIKEKYLKDLPDADTTTNDFWAYLGDLRRRQAFSDYMRDNGMRSAMTVAKRFAADDWKPFERIGILAILQQFIEKEQKITVLSS